MTALRPYRFAAAAALLALLLPAAGLIAAGSASAQPQPTLPRVQLQAGIHLISAEVASDHNTRARGLMFRERLGSNQGMLFVFTEKATQCFWMRNTLIPLSIAFIDDQGQIVNIADMQPRSDDSHCSAAPIRLALEMEQGWFAKRGIAPGATIGGLSAVPAAR